jgi:hypothetical protein
VGAAEPAHLAERHISVRQPPADLLSAPGKNPAGGFRRWSRAGHSAIPARIGPRPAQSAQRPDWLVNGGRSAASTGAVVMAGPTTAEARTRPRAANSLPNASPPRSRRVRRQPEARSACGSLPLRRARRGTLRDSQRVGAQVRRGFGQCSAGMSCSPRRRYGPHRPRRAVRAAASAARNRAIRSARKGYSHRRSRSPHARSPRSPARPRGRCRRASARICQYVASRRRGAPAAPRDVGS